MAESNWGTRIIEALFMEGGKQLFFWAVPPVLTGLTVYLGAWTIPWAYVMAAASIVFGTTTGGLLWFTQWRRLTAARDKVKLEWIACSADGEKSELAGC